MQYKKEDKGVQGLKGWISRLLLTIYYRNEKDRERKKLEEAGKRGGWEVTRIGPGTQSMDDAKGW